MKRKEIESNRRPAKRHFKRFVVFLLCFGLLGSDIPLVYAKTSSGDAGDEGFTAESASDANRPGEGSESTDNVGIRDEGTNLEEESKNEVEDQTENEPKERGNEENVEECDSRILQRTISAMIFEDDSYDRLLTDGTTITLTGEMPGGAVVKAYPVSAEIQGIVILAAYDISIFDEDGNIWQPGDDSIDVTIDNKDIRDAFANDRDIAVFHIDEDDRGEVEEIPLLSLSSRKARFSARHFSIYIVGDTGLADIEGQSVTKYVFEFYGYPSEDGKIICFQAVMPGEYLVEPAQEEIPNHVFNGWFSKPDGNGECFDFSETAEENLKRWGYDTDEKDIITTALYAYFTPVFYVYFMTQESGDPSVFYTAEYHENEPRLETRTAGSIYQDLYLTTDGGELYYAVTGWYFYDKNGRKNIIPEGSIIDRDIVLYPEIQSSVWIYFNMGGAETDTVDAPAPVYVLPGDKTIGEKFPADPERPGYEFEGWFTENKNTVTADTDIDSIEKTKGSILLYAVWKEAAAGYTVNIWRQKAESSISAKDDSFTDYSDEYDIAETVYVTADEDAALMTGSPLKDIFELEEWREWTGYAVNPAQDSHYLGFEYNENRTRSQPGIDSAVTAGDGSTVINIYYDRVTITWNFYGIRYAVRPSDSSTLKPVCRLQGLWGADLNSGDWPSAAEYIDGCIWCYEGISYRFDTSYKYLYLLNSTVPMTDVDFYLKDVQNGGTLCVYKEVLDQNAENISKIVVVDGVTKYYEHFTDGILIANNQYGISEKFNTHHAAGYIDNKGPAQDFVKVSTNNGIETPMVRVDDDQDQVIMIFYDLNSYDLTFYSNGEKLSERSYLYSESTVIPGEEEILAAVSDNPHIRPATHYVFAGWGASSSSTEPSPVYETMPGKDLVYYAVWKCKEISITYDPGAPYGTVTGMPQDEVTVAASRAAKPKDPVRAGYIFLGWKKEDGSLFNFNAILYDNIRLTAVWKPLDPSGHTLTYVVCGSDLRSYFFCSVPVTFYDDAEERVLTIEEVFENVEDIEFTQEEKDTAFGKFICWNSSIDGTGDNYYPDSKYTFDDSNGVVYSRFAEEKKAVLHLKYNYPEGDPPESEKRYEDIDITTENLAEIDLADISGLHKGDTITADGEEYGFAGWSMNEYASSEEEAEISPDSRISVNGSDNSLYAVWVKSGTEEKAIFEAETLVPAEQSASGNTGGGHRGTAVMTDKVPMEEGIAAAEEYKSIKGRQAEPALTDIPEEELPYTGDPGTAADTYTVLPVCFLISVIWLFIFLQIFKLVRIGV